MAETIINRLIAFQDEMEGVEILKSKEAYGYFYADLDAIESVIKPILRKHGIAYTHTTDYNESLGKNYLVTSLINRDDTDDRIISRWLIDGDAKLAKMNKFMVEGSAMTYFRRYHLVVMLGLLTDEDHDAGGKRKPSKAMGTPQTSSSPGRSVESNASEEPDYISIFTNLVKNKPKDKALKTLKMYQPQINAEDLKVINKVIEEAYDN